MIVAYEPEARDELGSATAYYAGILPELAERFIIDLEASVQRLLQFPNVGSPVDRSGGCRRCLLRRFPFQLIYRVEGEVICIYAVAHQKRRPGYWRKRAQQME